MARHRRGCRPAGCRRELPGPSRSHGPSRNARLELPVRAGPRPGRRRAHAAIHADEDRGAHLERGRIRWLGGYGGHGATEYPVPCPAELQRFRLTVGAFGPRHFHRPCFLRPQSRGTVKLRSSNPDDPALFNANSFSNPADLETLVRGVELAIGITEAPSLARLIKRRVLPEPGIEKDPGALRDYIRSVFRTVFHPSGTAKMGLSDDRMAVVGEDGRPFHHLGPRAGLFLTIRKHPAAFVANSPSLPIEA
ncbi:MAG: GMC family oxidoreductase [Hydrogenophaga sp.]|nr:GMC family oxidoreductase [Hydrogenophaga sp.]